MNTNPNPEEATMASTRPQLNRSGNILSAPERFMAPAPAQEAPVAAPEPSTGLMALGFVIPVGIAAVRRRRLENTRGR